MLNIELLVENASGNKKNYSIINKRIVYNYKKKTFGLNEINDLCVFAKLVHKSALPIVIDLGRITITDKLTINLLECICYFLITNLKSDIDVRLSCKNTIYTEGIGVSPLMCWNNCGRQYKEVYIKKFKSDISFSHFRRLLKRENDEDGCLVSSVMQDINSFMKGLMIEENCRRSIAEVVSELIDNSLEHGNGDCLFDLDITSDYLKLTQPGGTVASFDEKYYGINIVVINFSKTKIGDGLKYKIVEAREFEGRYGTIKEAYENHKKLWSNNYDDEDFFILSSFQHKISGRLNRLTGGTGLTKLIKSLEERSDAYNCFVISGDRVFNFIHRFLKYDDNDLIGFNDNNDYIKAVPDKMCFARSKFYMPGTAYNLNFVLKREVIDDERNRIVS